NLLAFVAAIAITIGGIGWYRDWFHIQTQAGAPGTRSVEININTKKIGDDLKKGEEKLIEKAEKKLEEKKDGATRPKDDSAKEPPVKTGYLTKATKLVDGRRTYVLRDEDDTPISYVVARPGVDLERYLNSTVELRGEVEYRSELRATVLTADAV